MVEHSVGPDFTEDLVGGLAPQSPKVLVPLARLDIGQVFEDFGRDLVGTRIKACPVALLPGMFQTFHQCRGMPFTSHEEHTACKTGILVQAFLEILGCKPGTDSFLP